jgi:hypothetical protein
LFQVEFRVELGEPGNGPTQEEAIDQRCAPDAGDEEGGTSLARQPLPALLTRTAGNPFPFRELSLLSQLLVEGPPEGRKLMPIRLLGA